jgi:hypothetical protein
MPVPSKLHILTRTSLIAYCIGSVYISRSPILDTYKDIYTLANTRNHEQTRTQTYITHTITTMWFLPIIPAILLFYPPYYATKTLFGKDDRV